MFCSNPSQMTFFSIVSCMEDDPWTGNSSISSISNYGSLSHNVPPQSSCQEGSEDQSRDDQGRYLQYLRCEAVAVCTTLVQRGNAVVFCIQIDSVLAFTTCLTSQNTGHSFGYSDQSHYGQSYWNCFCETGFTTIHVHITRTRKSMP